MHTLSGERTNLTFYEDVRVDDSLRLGAVDGGWDVMGIRLTLERAGAQGGESIRLLEAMEEWARTELDEEGNPVADDPGVRARLGRAAAENEVTTLLARRTAWISESGRLPGVEGSMAKLFASEAHHPAVRRLRGPARSGRDAEPGRTDRPRPGRGRLRLPVRPRDHHLRRHQ